MNTLAMIGDSATVQHLSLGEADTVVDRIPQQMMALVIRHEDESRLSAIPRTERRPSMALQLAQVPTPRPGPGEVLIAVMAAGINYNNVWSSLFLPESPFKYLRQFAALGQANVPHMQPFMVIGSDASGFVAEIGSGVINCKVGDRVCLHPGVTNDQASECHEDDLLSPETRAWGFETNYGAFAEYCLVKASQIMPKPAHLTWEEAASLPLVNGTVYRMLISPNGARMRLGDSVLIWGASGGLGLIACQYVLRAGGIPVAVVSNSRRAEILKSIGVEHVIDRSAMNIQLWTENGMPNERAIARMRAAIRAMIGKPDIDIVFEHPGHDTFWASVTLAKHGGKVVTCGSTTGYDHRYDNRRLWMHVKSIIGSHGANYYEACLANRLASLGMIQPVLTETRPLERGPELIDLLHANRHVGKCALLCQASQPGLGVTDPESRKRYLTGEFIASLQAG